MASRSRGHNFSLSFGIKSRQSVDFFEAVVEGQSISSTGEGKRARKKKKFEGSKICVCRKPFFFHPLCVHGLIMLTIGWGCFREALEPLPTGLPPETCVARMGRRIASRDIQNSRLLSHRKPALKHCCISFSRKYRHRVQIGPKSLPKHYAPQGVHPVHC